MNKIPQIGIVYAEGHEPLSDIASDFYNEVLCEGLEIRSESRPEMGPLACAEWYIPTAIFIFLSRSYFDSFLKEMGKDHYDLLKKGISKIWSKLFGKDKVIDFKVIGTPGKIPKELQYSLLFSILGEFNDNYSFKFLFENSVSKIEFDEQVNLIIDFLNSVHTNPEMIEEYLLFDSSSIGRGKTILVGHDPKNHKLKVIDPIPKHKNTNRI